MAPQLSDPCYCRLGEFVTFYSKSFTAEALSDSIADNVIEWKSLHPTEYHPGKEITKKVDKVTKGN